MYKKTISYEDFNGEKRTEDFYFNMTEVELMKWVSQPGGYTFDAKFNDLVKKENYVELIGLVEDLVKRSYGEPSLDGKIFVKSPELQQAFLQSNAYPVLVLEIATDDNAVSDFLSNVFPKDLDKTIEKLNKRQAELEAQKAAAEAALTE